MDEFPDNYAEKVYAGVTGKIVGVRLGAPVESWTSEQIQVVYGDVDGYITDYNDFAADDDINGTLFAVRALGDCDCSRNLTAEQIGRNLLNYAPYEHGYFWWGGYGTSTEHTAYLNLRNGILPPRSGSIEQNGPEIAEQIGGQIFIEGWGLVAPCNPRLAAEFAEKAASVTHGGNGVYGGMFIAACVSAAFGQSDIRRIIETGLTVIPSDCEYARVVNAVIHYHDSNPGASWRDALRYVQNSFGYDRYPGVCHIIPNAAVIILALLYGGGDFTRSVNICVMCGWDTDCNVANVGAILGVMNGMEGIDFIKWRKPIHDFVACSSVMGSLNITDIARVSDYIADKGYRIAGKTPPQAREKAFSARNVTLHFEYPDSTHSLRFHSEQIAEYALINTGECAHGGKRSLKIVVKPTSPGGVYSVFLKTYCVPSDFSDGRYEPAFSPVFYPGQTVTAYVMPSDACECGVSAHLYAQDREGNRFQGESVPLEKGVWTKLSYTVTPGQNCCLVHAGVDFQSMGPQDGTTLVVCLDDFEITGTPDYSVDFSKENTEVWPGCHREISQFTRLKGLWRLEDGLLSGSCSDFGEAYTGGSDWTDYTMECAVIPQLGDTHNVNFRVQGAMRSYAFGLAPGARLVLYKNENGVYRELAGTPFQWEAGKKYLLKVRVSGQNITASCGETTLSFSDAEHPYLYGCVGLSVKNGSHCHYGNLKISGA
jgi:ADP-ribosylglycohydrolase